jgi:hypothetical protein
MVRSLAASVALALAATLAGCAAFLSDDFRITTDGGVRDGGAGSNSGDAAHEASVFEAGEDAD